MHCLNMLLVAALAGPSGLDNLDFGDGTLRGWQGDGFQVVRHGDRENAVRSGNRNDKGAKAMLHRTFVVPPEAGTLHFQAYASTADLRLNVYLEAAERELVPKRVRTPRGFERTELLVKEEDGPHEYIWHIADRVGETLRIIVLDRDERPGRFVWCSGFRLEPVDQFETREFTAHLEKLQRDHRLTGLAAPQRSKHFLALGNATPKFQTEQLEWCELMHLHFFQHFRDKGFKLKSPPTRMMAAIFADQEGFEAYVGKAFAAAATGMYHLPTNRLVVYDFGRSKFLAEDRQRQEARLKHLDPYARTHWSGLIDRESDEIRTDTNLATIMHETAHQLSFNSGLLNRDGDLPLWLVEGIATYAEATVKGVWKGLGEMNHERLKALRRAMKGEQKLLPLRTLVENDRWLQLKGGDTRVILLGYAQSWALTRMLLEENPAAFRRYCETIYSRATSDHRLTDFLEAFGPNLNKLEERHRDYIKSVVDNN